MYHKANLNRIMSECTGQPIEKVTSSLRPFFMMRCLLSMFASSSAAPWRCQMERHLLTLVLLPRLTRILTETGICLRWRQSSMA